MHTCMYLLALLTFLSGSTTVEETSKTYKQTAELTIFVVIRINHGHTFSHKPFKPNGMSNYYQLGLSITVYRIFLVFSFLFHLL